MKKVLLFFTLFTLVLLVHNDVYAQPGKAKAYGKKHKLNHPVHQSFYYYPSANIYYNPVRNNYWYRRNNGIWINVNVLPSHIIVLDQPRYEVYYDGFEVWRENPVHFKRYKRPKKVIVSNAPPRNTGVSVDIRARF